MRNGSSLSCWYTHTNRPFREHLFIQTSQNISAHQRASGIDFSTPSANSGDDGGTGGCVSSSSSSSSSSSQLVCVYLSGGVCVQDGGDGRQSLRSLDGSRLKECVHTFSGKIKRFKFKKSWCMFRFWLQFTKYTLQMSLVCLDVCTRREFYAFLMQNGFCQKKSLFLNLSTTTVNAKMSLRYWIIYAPC